MEVCGGGVWREKGVVVRKSLPRTFIPFLHSTPFIPFLHSFIPLPLFPFSTPRAQKKGLIGLCGVGGYVEDLRTDAGIN